MAGTSTGRAVEQFFIESYPECRRCRCVSEVIGLKVIGLNVIGLNVIGTAGMKNKMAPGAWEAPCAGLDRERFFGDVY